MSEFDTVNQSKPICPNCGYRLDDDDMMYGGSDDLYAIAPEEGTATIECPQCDMEFWIRGSYKPLYTTAFSEELLDD